MNLLDLIIIIPVIYFGYKGFNNGFIHEVFSLTGLFIAIFFAFKYMHLVAEYISPLFNNHDTATIAACIITFIGILIIVKLFSFWLEKMLDIINLSIINKITGLAFGVAKITIFLSAIFLLIAGFQIPSEKNRNDSLFYDQIIFVAPMAYDAIASVYPKAENFIETIERNFQENNPIRTLPIFEKEEP